MMRKFGVTNLYKKQRSKYINGRRNMGRCGVLVDGAKRLKIGDGINGKKGNKN